MPVALDLANQALAVLGRHLGRDEPFLAARKQTPRGADAAHDELVQVIEHVAALALLAAPPRREARHRELLVEEVLAQARQEAQERVALDEAGAERIADRDRAGARRLQQPRHADQRVRAQLERIAKLGVDAAHDEVDALEPLDGLQVDAVVAHGEVRAFDEAEAQVAREIRVLEIVLLRRARRQEHGLRLVAWRQAQEPLGERAEEAREPAHVALREQLRQALRGHDAVLERVAGARRRLRAIADDPPAAVGRAREIVRDEVQVQVVADGDARARPEELRLP